MLIRAEGRGPDSASFGVRGVFRALRGVLPNAFADSDCTFNSACDVPLADCLRVGNSSLESSPSESFVGEVLSIGTIAGAGEGAMAGAGAGAMATSGDGVRAATPA